jgi:Transposase IS66 family
MKEEEILKGFDPNTIEDETVRQVVMYLMNMVERLLKTSQEQAEELQRRGDEINRLKGEQGKPKIRAQKKTETDVSSEEERRESKGVHRKEKKQEQIKIDREEVLEGDVKELPPDAQFKGYEEVIVQDIKVSTENIKFRKKKYYSAEQKKTYLAPLPAGYHGQFGPNLKAWVLAQYYGAAMSEPKILEWLHTVGVHISAGQLSELLIKKQEVFHEEKRAVVQAGLSSSSWQHLDSTASRVAGKNEHCHVLCNQLYTAYFTMGSKDRLAMVRVLLGGTEPQFRLNELALDLLSRFGLAQKWCEQIKDLLPSEQDYTQKQLETWLDTHLPKLGRKPRKWIKDALAIGAYRNQDIWSVVELLICDDAPQFNWLTIELALCWIHEGRHYKKLRPSIAYYRQVLETFQDDFWKFYRRLLAYRQSPSAEQALLLSAEFDQLFAPCRDTNGYEPLEERKALTRTKKASLLMVLSHPEILLHNNPAELGARQRVRKRDVSLHACTREGIEAWDTFQTLVATAKKLEVNIYQYFADRLTQNHLLPSLASLIQTRAQNLSLSASWEFQS